MFGYIELLIKFQNALFRLPCSKQTKLRFILYKCNDQREVFIVIFEGKKAFGLIVTQKCFENKVLVLRKWADTLIDQIIY